ncbi:MAG TPA: ion channel [Deltaproteobacteria bacterium]|nr:ion channel [Deltaproteobacteria bacterium]HPR54031.1 ion channel [Deltaproteobacteria bacterium]HXK46811.1 ion channel [Deltaproteobacteria bacterium]
MWKRLTDYVLSEPRQHTMSLFLVLLCAEVFFLGPLTRAEGPLPGVINGLVFSLLLIAGVLAMAPRPLVQVAAAAVVTCAIVLRWLANLHGSAELCLWDRVSSLAATLVFLALVLWQVYRESPATAHKIRGAVAAYLLLAMVFAFSYNIMELLVPGSFTVSPGGLLQAYRVDAFLYFSICTLTTVGYGDVTAVHPFARSLVMLESVIGILYPPVLIGVLVSLHTHWLREGDGKQG